MENSKVIITGANGFIGNFLASTLRENGFGVIPFVRKPDASKGEVFYDLNAPINESVLVQASVVIHCAYIPKSDKGDAISDNLKGTQDLIGLCVKHNVKLIFLSSLSAHETAESDYGKHKLLLEKSIDLSRNVVLKPGLVIGNGGLFLNMLSFAKKFHIIPLLDGGQQPIQFIAVADVANAALNAIQHNISGSFVLIGPERTNYKQFYQAISKVFAIRLFFIPVPISPILFVLTLFEKMRIKLPVGKENLLGLKNMKFIEPGSDMKKLGITPLSLTDALLSAKS